MDHSKNGMVWFSPFQRVWTFFDIPVWTLPVTVKVLWSRPCQKEGEYRCRLRRNGPISCRDDRCTVCITIMMYRRPCRKGPNTGPRIRRNGPVSCRGDRCTVCLTIKMFDRPCRKGGEYWCMAATEWTNQLSWWLQHCLYNYKDVLQALSEGGRILVHGCNGLDWSAAVVTAALSV